MNRFGNGYQESTTNSLKETETFVTNILQRKSQLVHPVVTPRFAPTCDQELLMGLGDIAKRYDVRFETQYKIFKLTIILHGLIKEMLF